MARVTRRFRFLRLFVGDRAFYRRVLFLVIPMIIQNTVTNVVSLLDNLMVGAIGTLPMASVAIVNQLIFVFQLCVFGGLAGAGIFSTQYAGARDEVGVRHCFRAKLVIVGVLFLIAVGVLLCWPRELVGWFLKGSQNVSEVEETYGLAQSYLDIMLLGILPFGLSMMYSSTLRELGETRVPMLASVSAFLTNLVFNYLLIFGKFGFPALGVVGAAWGTVISRFVELSIIGLFVHRSRSRFPFIVGAYRSLHVPGHLVGEIFRRGAPLLGNELLWSLGMTTLFQCYSLRGIDVVAATNISNTVANLFNCVFFSMGGAVAIIIGHELGANKLRRVRVTAWKLVALTMLMSVIMGSIVALVAPWMPRLYDTEAEVRHIATWMLWLGVTATPLRACAHVCYFTIRAGGRSFLTFMMDAGYSWLVVIPVTWYIGNFTDMDILPFYGISRWADGLKCIGGVCLVYSGIWIHNVVKRCPVQ